MHLRVLQPILLDRILVLQSVLAIEYRDHHHGRRSARDMLRLARRRPLRSPQKDVKENQEAEADKPQSPHPSPS